MSQKSNDSQQNDSECFQNDCYKSNFLIRIIQRYMASKCPSIYCMNNWYQLVDYYIEKNQKTPTNAHEVIDYYLNQKTTPIYEVLLKYVGKNIQIITEASPPAGKPPNITGKLIEVNTESLKIRLKSEHDGANTKTGIYFLNSILGFIPMSEGESGGCGGEKEKSPLVDTLKGLIGKRVNLIMGDSNNTQTSNSTGTVIEVTDTLVKMQLDQTSGTTEPFIVTYDMNTITGVTNLSSDKASKGKGGKGGKGGKDSKGEGSSKGQITVQVTINWTQGSSHPDEVHVTFIRDDVPTTLLTQGGIVTFTTQASGDFVIQGEAIPGFTIPVKKIRVTPSTPFVYEVLQYEQSTIAVTGITVAPSSAVLLLNETLQLTATVLPINANNQTVTWTSSEPTVASVDGQGKVTANSQGTVSISAITHGNAYQAHVAITVTEIREIVQTPSLSGVKGEIIMLPQQVSVVLNNADQTVTSVTVTWFDEETELDDTFKIPSTPKEVYKLTGRITQSILMTFLTIQVNLNAPEAIPVTGMSLATVSDSIYVGGQITIAPIVVPNDATNKNVRWSSSDTGIASVKEGVVIGISIGLAVITATTVDGGYEAYCQISVSAVPEIELIYPTQNVYNTRQEVVINVANLVAARVQTPTIYYIKVEQTGSDQLLGQGEIQLTSASTEFNLYAFTNFTESTNYNHQYYVYMSTDSSYPKSDEQTLSANFKVGSAVPTVPIDRIKVDLTIIGGTLSGQPTNIIFILARELDKPIETIIWQDYVIDPNVPDEQKRFVDEVKLRGKTDVEGIVIWEIPKEPLKLGGYVLLQVTPKGYIDNLNLINPDSSDGDLLKAVQLTRDDSIVRHITNTYNG